MQFCLDGLKIDLVDHTLSFRSVYLDRHLDTLSYVTDHCWNVLSISVWPFPHPCIEGAQVPSRSYCAPTCLKAFVFTCYSLASSRICSIGIMGLATCRYYGSLPIIMVRKFRLVCSVGHCLWNPTSEAAILRPTIFQTSFISNDLFWVYILRSSLIIFGVWMVYECVERISILYLLDWFRRLSSAQVLCFWYESLFYLQIIAAWLVSDGGRSYQSLP